MTGAAPPLRRATDPSVVLAAATVLLQIGYPLVRGDARDLLTVVTVVVFFLASTTHALLHRGVRWAALFVLVTTGTPSSFGPSESA